MLIICEINNQRGYSGASNVHVRIATWEECEAVLRLKFPDRPVAGDSPRQRVEALRTFLDNTCAVTFRIIDAHEEPFDLEP